MKETRTARVPNPCFQLLFARKGADRIFIFLLFISLLFTSSVFAQTNTITGTVKDPKGNGLAGVSVLLKGSSFGTSTDTEGKFVLKVPHTKGTLIFSNVGYAAWEEPVSNRSVINITLAERDSALNDVVVVGYGTQKKVTVTGAVSTISGQDLTTTTSTDMVNMMTGKLPGLRVAQKTGEPGNYATTFDIRGFGNPLIIVDGIPRDNNFRTLDPNDIESISILKDASAAVYGVRAANGAILITTKKGKTGKAEFNYNGTYGWGQITNSPATLNAYEAAVLKNEADFNAGITTPRFTAQQLADYRSGKLPGVDWYHLAMRDNSPQTQHNLSVRGGTDKVKYFISMGYLNEQGIWKTGDLSYKRYNFRSNVNAQLTSDLDVEFLLSGIFGNKLEPGESVSTVLKAAWFEDPTIPVYANDNPDYLSNVPGTWHPLASTNRSISGYYDGKNKAFTGIFALNYKIPFIDGLKARFMYSWDGNYSFNRRWQKKHALYDYDATNKIYVPTYRYDPSRLTQNFDQYATGAIQTSLNYEKTFASRHHVKALVLFEQRQSNGDNFFGARDFGFDVVDQLYAGNTLNQQTSSGSVTPTANQRLVGRLNYDFAGKYMLEGSFAYEGSSKFAEGHRWGFFPAVSAGWRISEENFIKENASFISNLKLRASYGLLGDDAASSFQYLPGYNYSSGSYITGANTVTSGLSFRGMPNPNITWYESRITDVGLDVGIFQNKLSATIDVFRRKRTNLLATRALTLPGTVGAGLPQENLNSDISQGVDLSLTYAGHKRQLQYSVTGIFSYARNLYGYIERATSTNSFRNWRDNNNDRFRDIYWGYGYLGQFTSMEQIMKSPAQDGQGNRTLLPGDLKYEDYNGDGIIDDNDVHPIGRAGSLPEVTFGLTLNLAWKGFDVNMLFQGATSFYVRYTEQLEGPLMWDRGGLNIFMDRWHRTNEMDSKNNQWVPGKYPSTRISGSLPYNVNHFPSNFWLHDASYLRLKSAEIGYTIPSRVFGKATIKGVRVFANGFNLVTWTGLKLVDPEHTADNYGYEYPIMKNYNVGVNVNF